MFILIITILVTALIIYLTIGATQNNVKQSSRFEVDNVLDYVMENTYCGVQNDPHLYLRSDNIIKGNNLGPKWRRNVNRALGQNPTYCGQRGRTGNGDYDDRNEQDFWLAGTNLETLANYAHYFNNNKYLKLIGDISPSNLLIEQLAAGKINNIQINTDTFGVLNDDANWWALAFLRMYEYDSKTYERELSWAVRCYNHTKNYAVDDVMCNNKPYKCVRWGSKLGPTTDEYHNAINNSEMLILALKLYKISLSKSEPDMETSADYLTDAINFAECLSLMIKDGLVTDGLSRGTCNLADAYYTYNQGLAVYGFALLASVLKNDESKKYLDYSLTIISKMTSPPNDVVTAKLLLNVAPGIYVLNEGYGNDQDGSQPAFKGIFVRYLAYTITLLETFPNASTFAATLTQAKKFIRDNVDWVVKHAKNNSPQNELYGFYWDTTTNRPDYTFTNASSFSVGDLLLAAEAVNA